MLAGVNYIALHFQNLAKTVHTSDLTAERECDVKGGFETWGKQALFSSSISSTSSSSSSSFNPFISRSISLRLLGLVEGRFFEIASRRILNIADIYFFIGNGYMGGRLVNSYTRQIFSREHKYSSWRSFTIILVWLLVSHRNINRKGSKVKKHNLKLDIDFKLDVHTF